MKLRLILLGALALACGYASAQDHAVAGKIGFLGLGIEYGRSLGDRLGVRVGLNGAQLGFDAEESGISYDFEFVWDSLLLAVDYHPTGGPFRVNGGVLSNDNRLEAESRPTQNVDVGGTAYSPEEVGTLVGLIEFDSMAPFVGIGWDWSRSARGFGVSLDIGIVKHGAPAATLTGTGTLLGDPQFEADIAAEQAELQASLDDFDLVPYATFGFVFRF